MKKPLYKRKRFWGIIVVILFFLSLTFFNYIKFLDTKFVGEVVEINNLNLTILDRKTGEQKLQLTNSTHIIYPNDTKNSIEVGDELMIFSKKINGILEIQNIRVLPKNHKVLNSN